MPIFNICGNTFLQQAIVCCLFLPYSAILQVPAEMGGVELNFTAACLAIEEVAKVDPAVSALMDRA